MIKKIRINENEPKRRRFIKENVITDLRKLLNHLWSGDRKNAENWFRDSNINIEDCSLFPIDKPKGPTIAKKSDWPIIAIDDKGNAFWFGNDKYQNVSSRYQYQNMKQTDAFNNATEFYKVVPNDVDTYQTRTDIHSTRTPGKFVDVDEFGKRNTRRERGVYDKPYKGTRFMTPEEMDLYNPNINKKKYDQLLANMGADRYIKMYNDLCDKVIEVNNRIKNIDLDNLIKYDTYDSTKNDYRTKLRHYTSAINMYYQTIDAFEALHGDIKQMVDSEWGGPYDWEYVNIKNDMHTIKYRLEDVIKSLDSMDF